MEIDTGITKKVNCIEKMDLLLNRIMDIGVGVKMANYTD